MSLMQLDDMSGICAMTLTPNLLRSVSPPSSQGYYHLGLKLVPDRLGPRFVISRSLDKDRP